MDWDDLMPFVVVAAVVLGVTGLLLFVWLGFKLLLLPLRLLWRFGRALEQQIGRVPLLLLLVWTVALVPDPFLYLWRWFVRFGQALLVDTMQQAGPAVGRVLDTCSRPSGSGCVITATIEVQRLWTAAIGVPVREFDVPPQLGSAALWFAIGTTLACIAASLPAASERSTRTDLRTIAALTASFAFALYLAIVAIIAIPVFVEKAPDLAPYRTSLADQLRAAMPTDPAQYPIDELDAERKALPDIAKLRPVPPDTAGQPRLRSSFLDAIESYWTSQLASWDESANNLKRTIKALPVEAGEFARSGKSFFEISNAGRISEAATQRHVTALVYAYNEWVADYRAGVGACGARLSQDLGAFRNFYAALVPTARSLTDGGEFPADQISQIGRSLQVSRCGDVKPIGNYLPARTGPAETLGPFGVAAAWLLRTESPELALIIGLLGFGFFGALAASFIREFAGTSGNDLPSMGFIVPALIRGIGAAILVFLLAKGGTAIFTRGDATPNAYAIFFACFVAAVFSEDVWSWARTRQRTQLPSGDGKAEPRPGEPAAAPKAPPPDAPSTPAPASPGTPSAAASSGPATPSAAPATGWSRYAG